LTATWKRIAIGLRVTWGVILVVLLANTWKTSRPFEHSMSQPCPQIEVQLIPSLERTQRWIPKVFVWHDIKTRRELILYREGERSLRCEVLESRAQLLAAGAKLGVIQPQLRLKARALALWIVLPYFLLAGLSYLIWGRRSKSVGRESVRGAV